MTPARSTPPAAAVERFARVAPFVVIVATIVAFLPALSADFVSWDDDKNFVENFAWRGLGPDQLRWMWTTFHLGTWIPLSWMSLGLDYLVWGMEPSGYHITNIVLHAACAALVYFLARRVLRDVPGSADNHAIAAAFGALVFSVHPLRVESVAWITERRDVLSGCFYVGTLLAYMRYAQERRRSQYLTALACGLLALLAKGTAVTLPIALLLLNVWPLRRLGGSAGWMTAGAQRAWREIVPFAVLAAVFTFVVFTALQPEEQLPLAGKVAVSAYSLRFYLWKSFLPMGLSPLYEMPRFVSLVAPMYLASAAIVVIVGALTFAARKRAPGVTIAVIGFVAVLFPLLGVHQGGPQIAADRNTYNASIALALLAGGALLAVSRRSPRASLLAAAGVVVALGTLTWRQVGVWHDSITLWSRVLEVEPNSSIGHNNMGNLLLSQGNVAGAELHYGQAIHFRPDYAEAHSNLGVALATRGEYARAIPSYRRAAELKPLDAKTENNWGVALSQMGKPEEALEHFSNAVIANRANAQVHVNWANALLRLGRVEEAEGHYRDALTWQPGFAEAHLNWGVALARTGRLAEAAAQFESAIASDPSSAQAAEYLSRVRAQLDKAGTRPKSP